MKYTWFWITNYLLRILNLFVSAFVAFEVYNFVYERYATYLPIKYYLDQLNNQNSISALLRENSQGFRELYIHNFEKSLLYSFISFIICFFSIEYVYRSNQKKKDNSSKILHEKKFKESWDRV